MKSKESPALKKEWTQRSVTMLEQGDSQISIITFLRSQGVSDELAKELSYDIFAAARKQIRRKQLPHRIIAWSLIAIGIVLPIILLLKGRIVIYSVVPIILGMGYLQKLPNPKGLPRN